MSKLKIGIFLGTFDPIHNGHISIARNLTNELDKVIIVPLYDAPHKDETISSAAVRLQMCRVALLGEKNIEVTDEIIRHQIEGYDIDIIHQLKKAYKDAELHYILGSDVFNHILSWPSVHELESLVSFSVILREKEDLPASKKVIKQLNCPCKIHEMALEGISSTMIRHGIKNKLLVSRFLHPDILSIIKSNNLYK
ncbi:nicotinate (nicotinamide) nucleotide adenylyltransferase [Acidaminobacter sp. JC074]|uniref:nicotinate (nicotinamide) nucleotide adenylyltransferase n=1 Tax=Acidaminobacter sp. JC074 TaxID=2530199 RepID=UPI001F0F4BB6|nr:nicotinate (nicotinamide) nucleotide adenylyltransferase [Acidaminobacter sp. JC074]